MNLCSQNGMQAKLKAHRKKKNASPDAQILGLVVFME
jgi:hypothetical protein